MEDLREVTSFSSRAMALGRISKLRKTKYDFYVAGDSSNFVFLKQRNTFFTFFFVLILIFLLWTLYSLSRKYPVKCYYIDMGKGFSKPPVAWFGAVFLDLLRWPAHIRP